LGEVLGIRYIKVAVDGPACTIILKILQVKFGMKHICMDTERQWERGGKSLPIGDGIVEEVDIDVDVDVDVDFDFDFLHPQHFCSFHLMLIVKSLFMDCMSMCLRSSILC